MNELYLAPIAVADNAPVDSRCVGKVMNELRSNERSLKMQELNVLLPGIMSVLSLAAILIVLLFTILRLLRAASFFQGKIAVIMALCISILFIVGMSQLLLVPGGTHNKYHRGQSRSKCHCELPAAALPCLALAVAAAVVLSQVLLLASRISPSEDLSTGDGKTEAEESECAPAKPKSPERPKKAESGRPLAAQKPGGKGKSEAKKSTTAEGTAMT